SRVVSSGSAGEMRRRTGATEFAAALRAIKERTGLGYRELAQGSLMSRATLHRYCEGKAIPPDFGMIMRFAKAHGASDDELATLHRKWVSARNAMAEGIPESNEDTDDVVPRQLPAASAGFTGRGDQLELIRAGLSAAPQAGTTPIVVIQGPAGVGKSTLAV